MTQLAGFEGVLQVDGYAAYASLAGDAQRWPARSGWRALPFVHASAATLVKVLDKTTNLALRQVSSSTLGPPR